MAFAPPVFPGFGYFSRVVPALGRLINYASLCGVGDSDSDSDLGWTGGSGLY